MDWYSIGLGLVGGVLGGLVTNGLLALWRRYR